MLRAGGGMATCDQETKLVGIFIGGVWLLDVRAPNSHIRLARCDVRSRGEVTSPTSHVKAKQNLGANMANVH